MISQPKNPKISVVLLNYNGLKYLRKTLPAILNLDYSNYEVIIVDNASEDGSINFVEKFPQVRLIKNKENLGYSQGKNIGYHMAKGEYVLLLDNDILIENRNLLCELIENINDRRILHVPLLDIGMDSTKYLGMFFSLYGVKANTKVVKISAVLSTPKKLIAIGAARGAFIFFKKEIFENLGGFDESQPFNLDDIDLGPRAWIYGYEVNLYTKTYAIHLGVGKVASAENYANRFRLLFSGHARSMVKNCNWKNLLIRFPLLCFFHFFKAIKFTIKKRSLGVMKAFLYSVSLFLKNFGDTLEQRKVIQSRRKIKRDIFFDIKAPVFANK